MVASHFIQNVQYREPKPRPPNLLTIAYHPGVAAGSIWNLTKTETSEVGLLGKRLFELAIMKREEPSNVTAPEMFVNDRPVAVEEKVVSSSSWGWTVRHGRAVTDVGVCVVVSLVKGNTQANG